MANTPSKDYKRLEREQKKRDKRMARAAAKEAKAAEEKASAHATRPKFARYVAREL